MSDRALFSHVLRKNLFQISKLEDMVSREPKQLSNLSAIGSLRKDYTVTLKGFLGAATRSNPRWNFANEIYARVMSEENGEYVSPEEAAPHYETQRTKSEGMYYLLPKAVFTALNFNKPDIALELAKDWLILASLGMRETAIVPLPLSGAEQIKTKGSDLIRTETPKKLLKGSETNIWANVAASLLETDMQQHYEKLSADYAGDRDIWMDTTEIDIVFALEKINAMVGMQKVKEFASKLDLIHGSDIHALKKQFVKHSAPSSHQDEGNDHIALLGSPGTGKTTIARHLAEFFREKGLISKGHLVEAEPKDLIAEYIGQSAIKTTNLIERAKGGVLFIDEAYGLFKEQGRGNIFAQEAIDTLIPAMENVKDLVVIMAGYPEPMDVMLKSNPGMARRVAHIIKCDDYTVSELMEIADKKLHSRGYHMDHEARALLERKIEKTKENVDPTLWGNGGFVRDYIKNIIREQDSRLIKRNPLKNTDKSDEEAVRKILFRITIEDVAHAEIPMSHFANAEKMQTIGFKLSPAPKAANDSEETPNRDLHVMPAAARAQKLTP